MPVEFDVQRTIKTAEIWTLFSDLSELSVPAEIYSDKRGVVHALDKGEAECIGANHRDADPWMRVWERIHDHSEQAIGLNQ